MCAPRPGHDKGPQRDLPWSPSSFFTRAWKHSSSLNRLLILSTLLLLAAPVVGQQDLIVGITVHGNRRIPADTVKARIFSKVGDVYDAAAIERDFNALWNAGYFEDIRFEREQSAKGWILHIYLKERPTIREINYTGLNAVSTSDVLDRFKERKVGLSVESQFDPTKIKRAEVVLKELRKAFALGERHLHADHIVPIQEDPNQRLSIENMQTLCDLCHRRKTQTEGALATR